jgi:pyridoxal phosphate enzyme (YggS family)
VSLVAVTKGFGPDEVVAALRAGVDGCAENYAQELVGKAAMVAAVVAADAGLPDPVWHFVGRLQRNKVRHVAPLVSVWQSVDRVELGAEIARRSPGATVMVQCNISGEDTKGGVALADAGAVVGALGDLGLNVVGLMGVAAAGDPAAAGDQFAELVAVADVLGLPERSIGMSGDFEQAVAAGATSVRLGTVLFGQRPPRIGTQQ